MLAKHLLFASWGYFFIYERQVSWTHSPFYVQGSGGRLIVGSFGKIYSFGAKRERWRMSCTHRGDLPWALSTC